MKSSTKVVRYLLGGLLIGGFWYLNRSRPPAEEALRTIVVFAVLMTLLRTKLRARAVDVHLVPLIAAKAVLVVIAALVEESLKNSTSNPALVVAIGLGVAAALTGAVGDRYFFTPQARSARTRSNQPVR